MRVVSRRAIPLLAAVFLAGPSALAQRPAPTPSPAPDRQPAQAGKPAEPPAEPKETSAVTKHVVTIDGVRLAYTATAGTLVLRDAEGKARASMFYVAYVKDGVDDPAARPVTYAFNGGPGSAALWVQYGAFGPKRVVMDDDGRPMPPPGTLVDNAYSILDITDLVFIDPVGTGFSRPASGADTKQFYSLRGDIESVGEFIRLWTVRNERWASPKFVAGESYGTTRAAGLALFLQQRYGLYLNGVVMVSTILNWQDQDMYPGNDMPYIIHLPTYAATAWYYKKVPAEYQRDLGAFLKEVEGFAIGEYASALLQGDWLTDARRREVADKVSRYTGLSADFILRANLRIELPRFTKELLRDRGQTVGRIDTRFLGYDRDSAGERPEYDPSGEAFNVGYVAMLNDYLRRELGYESDQVYEFSARVGRTWTWDENSNRYANVAEDLRSAMNRNPSLKVLFASGYFDLATPYFDTPYSVAQMMLPKDRRANITIEHYEAGHMMYVRKDDHAKLKRDIAAFFKKAVARP